jgi:outer membrane protein assembly factor BamE
MTRSITGLFLLLALTISGCSSYQFPGVYQIQVPQGNVYTQEMLDELKPGLTRSQVRYIMGTPLIEDTFNSERWDYTYRVQKGDEVSHLRSLTLTFDGDTLTSIEKKGDVPQEG